MSISTILLIFIPIWIIVLLVAAYKEVRPGHIAPVERLGKLTGRVLEQGPHLIWPGIEKARSYSTRTQEDEFPANPEDVEKGDEDNVPPGKKQPFRIVQTDAENGKYYVQDSKDPNIWKVVSYKDPAFPETYWKAMVNDTLSRAVTTEVQIVVEWYLAKDCVLDFVNNVKTFAEARSRMEDMVARALQNYLGAMTAGHTRDVLAHISEIIENDLRVFVGEIKDASGKLSDQPWGIKIRRAYIKSIDPGKTVNMARAKAAAAVGLKVAAIEEAEGDKIKVQLAADALEYQDEHLGLGRGKRLTAEAAAMKTEEGRLAAQLDVAREALPKANIVFAPSDIGAIGGVLTLGAAINKGAPPRNPPAVTQTK